MYTFVFGNSFVIWNFKCAVLDNFNFDFIRIIFLEYIVY
jgi:hypothetical protein